MSERHRNPEFPIDLGGSPVMVHDLKKAMFSDMPVFVLASLGVIALLLAILFRRLSGLVLPILTVIFSLLTALGLVAATGTKMTIVMQILPSFLLAVGIGYSVHLLVIYYRHLRDHGDKGEAIAFAMGHSGLAILITSLTTAGGLLSFVPVKVAPVSDLGLFGAAGVLLCVFFHPGSLTSPAFGASRRKTCSCCRKTVYTGNISTPTLICRPDAQRLWKFCSQSALDSDSDQRDDSFDVIVRCRPASFFT